MTATARHALLLETSLVVETPATLNPRTLSEMQREIWALSDLITTEYLS
jgi:hypothetical protein